MEQRSAQSDGGEVATPRSLGERFGVVFLFMNFDAARANLLLGDYLDERLPENCIMLQTVCKLHALNRIAVDFMTKAGLGVVSPVFSLAHLMQIGTAVVHSGLAHQDLSLPHYINLYLITC